MKSEHLAETLSSPDMVTPTMRQRRVLLVEAHPIVRNGIVGLINYQSDLDVCGVAVDQPSALHKLEALRPDLLLIGTVALGNDEWELLNAAKTQFPDQRILMLSGHDEDLFAPKALRAGASGYVMKQEPTGVLLNAIRRVLEGKTFVSDRLRDELRNASITKTGSLFADPLQSLTRRELEVFRMLGQGRTPPDIAATLGISHRTVAAYRTRIKDKLGLNSLIDMIRIAKEFSAPTRG